MPITDYKVGLELSGDAPYTHAAAVTPSNSADLAFRTNALWVGGAGDISFITMNAETVTLTSVPAGTLLRVRADRVRSTGTTATNIVALS